MNEQKHILLNFNVMIVVRDLTILTIQDAIWKAILNVWVKLFGVKCIDDKELKKRNLFFIES